MYEISPHLKLLDDVLREETRKERRNLLISNAVGIAIVKAGLIPKQISAFGVTSDVNEQGLLIVLTGVTVYFLIAFLVYAYSDWVAHGYALRHAIAKRMDEFNEKHKDDEYKFREFDGSNVIMPAYIPRTPEYEKLFLLWNQMQEVKKSYASKEVDALALERGSILMILKLDERKLERPYWPINKKEKEQLKQDVERLRTKVEDLNRKLTALGAQKLMELQDEASALNARIADTNNRKMARYYEETGLDFNTAIRFMPASLLRFLVDFIIPIGTGIYAIVCMLRGR